MNNEHQNINIDIKMNDSPNINSNMKRNKIPRFVRKAILFASLGGILFGYDLGVISGALPQLRNGEHFCTFLSYHIMSYHAISN
jgi:hypothetical protein